MNLYPEWVMVMVRKLLEIAQNYAVFDEWVCCGLAKSVKCCGLYIIAPTSHP